MFSDTELLSLLDEMDVTHVVWLPDSTIGLWNRALRGARDVQLVQVCREGEAWAIAGGLFVGGMRPLVMIQCTGLFESGDALRNMLFDFELPLFAFVGYRSYRTGGNLPNDTARRFTEPILNAWSVDHRLIEHPEQRDQILHFRRECTAAQKPGVVLIAEGKA